MNFLTAVFAFLTVAQCATTLSVASDAPVQLETIKEKIRTDIQPRLREAITQPQDPRSEKACKDANLALEELSRLPEPPTLMWVDSADRYRFMGFLETLLACVEGEREAYSKSIPGRDVQQLRLGYARAAVQHLETALAHCDKGEGSGLGTSDSLTRWMSEENLRDHIRHTLATAHAIVWKVTGEKSHRSKAKKYWTEVAPTYGRKMPQPSPELASALALYRWNEDPRQMQTVFWVGVGLICLATVIAMFLPHPSSFQMFVFRLLASLGASGIGANIPGFLNFDSPGVTAGGAMALFAIVWLVNPPALARNLAGNDPKN